MDFLVSAAATHPGAVKEVNEDRVVDRAPVFLVADGISGCQRGELASGLVAEHFEKLAERPDLTPDIVAEAVTEAHERVRRSQRDDGHRAATTLAAAIALHIGGAPYWMVVNSGDSRVYRTGRQGPLVLITDDHTHARGLVELGVITPEAAESHPQRNVLTQAVGSSDRFAPDFWLLPITVGERLLLCSDGLLGETDPAQVEEIVHRRSSPQEAVAELLSLALAAGARDNVSIVVVDVTEELVRSSD